MESLSSSFRSGGRRVDRQGDRLGPGRNRLVDVTRRAQSLDCAIGLAKRRNKAIAPDACCARLLRMRKTSRRRQGLPIHQPHRVGDACGNSDAGLDHVHEGEKAQRRHHAARTKAGHEFGPNVGAVLTDCVMSAHFRQRCVSPLPKSKNAAMGPDKRSRALQPRRRRTNCQTTAKT
jgi:hypothetical protein